MKEIIKLPPFKRFCMTIGNLPSSYVESLTYAELLYWFCDYLQNKVIPTIDNNAQAVQELQNLFTQLQNYVNNYFENLDVQEEINNKLDEMVESGTLEEIIGNYINNNIIRVFENIESLKNDENLVIGIKAKTLGYYNINDGGASFYIIREKTQEDFVDEGSIIELTNNLVAELIIENDFINYKQFGAKLDNNDDSRSIINAHNFANSKKLKVITGKGTLLCNFTVDVYTDVDASGLTFILDDNTPTGVYNIKSETEIDEYEYNQTFTTGQIDNFNDFKKKFFVITKEDETYLLGGRQGDTENLYYHRQPIAVDGTGKLISSPFYLGNIGTFTVKYEKDLYEKGIVFKNGTIKTDLTKIGFPHFIRCTRNNTLIENFVVENTKTQPTSTDNYAYGLFNIIGCANITIRNIIAQNNTINPTTAHSYVLDITDCFNVVLDNIVLTQGWGAIASHFCDTIKCVNSVINRFDNHYGCFGTYILANSNLVGVGQCCAGYGNADFIIDNVLSNGYTTNQIFYTRNDFNITFSGTLKIKDVKLFNNVSRLVLYQLGTGTANTQLENGTFTVKVYNIILPNNLVIQLATGTEKVIPIFIYNSEIMPCSSTSAEYIQTYAYNSILRNVSAMNTTELYNCKVVTFRGAEYQGSTILMSGGSISSSVNNTGLKLAGTGLKIGGDITCDIIILVGSYKSGTGATVTANTKHIEGCYNIA